jgi:hypothetical protein
VRKNQSFAVKRFVNERLHITTSVENARALERAVSWRKRSLSLLASQSVEQLHILGRVVVGGGEIA